MEETEDSYEERARDKYARFQTIHNTLAKLNAKCDKVAAWVDRQTAVFTRYSALHPAAGTLQRPRALLTTAAAWSYACSGGECATVSEGQHQLDGYKAYEQQLVAFKQMVDATDVAANGEGMVMHASHEEMVARVAALRTAIAQMEQGGATYVAELQARIAYLQDLQAKGQAFNSMVRGHPVL